jgi:hypothetical protein
MTEETNKCTACSCDFTDDEGGIHGDFGILPMSFCPNCLSCVLDMAEQINPREWVGLTEDQIDELEKEFIGFPVPNIYNFVQAIEAKLKEKNT